MVKRKTNFRWFKKKGSRKLTIKAKKWLSKKLKEHHRKKKQPPKFGLFRYSAFKLWSIQDDEEGTYYPQLEIKAHIFSKKLLNKRETKTILNEMIRKTKDHYDINDFFIFEVTRRRIAYEAEQISREEFQSRDITILTVNDDIDTIRDGFPKTRFF